MNLLLKPHFLIVILVFIFSYPVYAIDYTKVVFNSRIIKSDCVGTAKGRNKSQQAKLVKTSYGRVRKCTTGGKTKAFVDPRIGGLRIDACVYGAGWKKTDTQRCDMKRRLLIAAKFCKSKGFRLASKKIIKVSHKGRHAVLTYNKRKPKNTYWKKKKGKNVIKIIVCAVP